MTQRRADDLVKWLQPYREVPFGVLATISDGEEAIVAALRICWPTAPHQRCQEHFLSNLAAPVLKVDSQLCKQMRDELGYLPAVPTRCDASVTPVSERPMATETPFCLPHQASETES